MSLEQAIGNLNYRQKELQPGHVWLVGAGPGDPGCLTLDALSALSQADALVHDALVSDEIIAVATQARWLARDTRRRCQSRARHARVRRIVRRPQQHRLLRCCSSSGIRKRKTLREARRSQRFRPWLPKQLLRRHARQSGCAGCSGSKRR